MMNDGARDRNDIITRAAQSTITDGKLGLHNVLRRKGEVESVVALRPKRRCVARRNQRAAMINCEVSDVIHPSRYIVGDREVHKARLAFGHSHGELVGVLAHVVRGNLAIDREGKSRCCERSRNHNRAGQKERCCVHKDTTRGL